MFGDVVFSCPGVDLFCFVFPLPLQVLPVGEHTIKFAIGDQTDYSYDSAVFIEGNAVIVPVDDFTDDLFDDDVTASVLSDPHIQGKWWTSEEGGKESKCNQLALVKWEET